MKLKYNFVVNPVADKQVAVAVGDDLEKFGGFIKMNNFNMNLQKRKNELKDLIKANSRKDKKAHSYLNSFMNEQNSKAITDL